MKSFFFPLVLILSFFSTSISVAQSVTKTESGFEYIHHIKNKGPKPQEGDWVYFKCDFKINEAIVEAWQEGSLPLELQMYSEDARDPYVHLLVAALSGMTKGDSLTLLVPADSLPEKPLDMKSEDFFRFDIVLIDIITNEEKMASDLAKQKELETKLKPVSDEAIATLEAYKANSLGDKLITTSSGLKYVVHLEGSGPKAMPGQYVLVDYYGMLSDGSRFDDSYKNGYPFGFPLGREQAIPGFDEALLTLPVGSRFTVFIPAHLAFGENGAPPVIPPNAEIIFHLNFIKIESQY